MKASNSASSKENNKDSNQKSVKKYHLYFTKSIVFILYTIILCVIIFADGYLIYWGSITFLFLLPFIISGLLIIEVIEKNIETKNRGGGLISSTRETLIIFFILIVGIVLSIIIRYEIEKKNYIYANYHDANFQLVVESAFKLNDPLKCLELRSKNNSETESDKKIRTDCYAALANLSQNIEYCKCEYQDCFSESQRCGYVISCVSSYSKNVNGYDSSDKEKFDNFYSSLCNKIR